MTNLSPATQFLLQLSMLKGIGPAALKKVSRLPEFATHNVMALIDHMPAIRRAVTDTDAWDTARRLAEHQVDLASKNSAAIVSALDEEYPQGLMYSRDDPFIIYVKGRFPLPRTSVVAVIGTRAPTKHGSIIAERITEYFSSRGASILSGLALGCDSIAHKTAVRSAAHTIAVLAHGLHTIAPSGNRHLAASILDSGGTLVSEYPFGIEPRPAYFVQRDRTQAGLSHGVVMVQSDVKGGSLHASRAILNYGRWLAIPYPTESDIRNEELKIQANLVLAGDDVSSKLRLLETEDPGVERNIIILRGKEDYGLCPLRDIGFSGPSQTAEASQLNVPLDLL